MAEGIMFAITADQVDSRTRADRVDQALGTVADAVGDAAVLPPERTAGDEFQLLVASGEAVLDAVSALVRRSGWSVGVGVGAVELPLPSSTRAATGPAFFAARTAVERAKAVPERFALEVAPGQALPTGAVEPLVAQHVRALARRSAEGWELAELLAAGRSRIEAAAVLDITPQAVAKRYASAELRNDAAVRTALARLLDAADRADRADQPDRPDRADRPDEEPAP